MLDKIALALVVIGGINWGLIGIFRFDLVAWIFGGQAAILSRIIYTLVGIAALWCITLIFRDSDTVSE
ncbi:MAG: DUF378 domain-containing protein [Acutalibacter sp.]